MNSSRFPTLSRPVLRRSLAVTALALFAGLAANAQAAGALRAGIAKINITPEWPVQLSGYASRTNLSQGVHDPLTGRALAFEDQGQRLVLVSVENVGFYNGTAEPLRQAILEACQLAPSELFLCATHTHSAPTLMFDDDRGRSNNVAYTRQLRSQLVELVQEALRRLAPARVGSGSGSSPVGVNRRQVVSDASGTTRIVLGRNPAVLTDREVQVLKLVSATSGKMEAAVFGYATHSTSLGPRNYLVSGDIHGLAAQFLEKHLGDGFVAPAFAGASGDIDPWVRILPGFKTTNSWVPEPILLGTLLGEEVATVLESINSVAADGPIKTLARTIQLPGKARGSSQPAADNPPIPFNITVGRVGEVAFAGLGGEVFNGLGQSIKAASPFARTFILTHCNGAAGYIPTRPSYAEGGYEVQSSPVAPGGGEQLVQEALRLLRELE